MTAHPTFSESQITLMVPDMAEAVRFYTESLGLHLKAQYGNEFAVVEAPGLTIGLHPQTAESKAPSMSIGLGVESIESVMQSLAARGIRFDGAIVEDPPIRVVHFKGPGAAPLYLVEQSQWR